MALKTKKTREEIILDLIISLNQSNRTLRADQIVTMAFEEYNYMERLVNQKNQKRNDINAPTQLNQIII